MTTVLLLLFSIVAIILLSSRFRIHTFLVLFCLTIVVGLLAGMPSGDVLKHLRAGFGHTLEKIGLLVILGTILGSLLDKSHATHSIASAILHRVGEQRAPLAITMMAFLVGLPIFCDSGFIVLSGLVLTLAQRLRWGHLQLVLCLAGGLYAVHCLVPPHPGITAAVGILNVDTGRMILLGSLLAVPGASVSYFWAKWAEKQYGHSLASYEPAEKGVPVPTGRLPPARGALLAILVPIALIAFRSVISLTPDAYPALLRRVIDFAGDPIMALCVGIGLSLRLLPTINKQTINELTEEAIVKAGPVLVIVGAGGAFGEVIQHMDIGQSLSAVTRQAGPGSPFIGLLVPFLLTVVFKTAQGSSTVAVLSAASILQPLLPALGFDTDWDKLLVLAAMGAGSMMLSHANDAYFWVVARFGQLPAPLMLKSYSIMSVLMGLATFMCLWLMQLIG